MWSWELWSWELGVPLRLIGVIDVMGGRAVHARGGRREHYQPVRSVADRPIRDGDASALAHAYVEELGLTEDPVARDGFANMVIDGHALRLLGYRTLAKARKGVEATEQSMLKLFGSEAAQAGSLHLLEVQGPEGLDPTTRSAEAQPLHGDYYTASWFEIYLRAFAGTIAGGTSQIQRNIIAERVLGLPR